MNSWSRGESSGRLSHRRVLIGFGVAFAAVIGIAAVVAAVSAPGSREVRCPPYDPCGTPPTLPKPLVNLQVWRSRDYGFSLEYPGDIFEEVRHDGREVLLETPDGNALLIVEGDATNQVSPTEAISARLDNLRSNLLGLDSDTDPADALLGTNVGHRPGVGGPFVAYIADAQGVGQPVSLAVQSATDHQVTITTTVLVASSSPDYKASVYSVADPVFNTVTWRSGGGGSG